MMPQEGVRSDQLPMAETMQERVTPFDDIASVHALYEERIFRFLLLSVRDRDVAMSLTQDTFLNAWRTRANFRGDCSIATWLTYIAMNLLRSHTRTEYFRFWKKAAAGAVSVEDLKAQLPHPAQSVEKRLMAQQELEQVWRSVENLSKAQRTIFLLRFVEEMELAEIAKVMRMPVPTVKSHLYRALDHVRSGRIAGCESLGAGRVLKAHQSRRRGAGGVVPGQSPDPVAGLHVNHDSEWRSKPNERGRR
ncbi:MAG: RNA polymerase sigma factor [Acidobacteriaceae bacterium]